MQINVELKGKSWGQRPESRIVLVEIKKEQHNISCKTRKNLNWSKVCYFWSPLTSSPPVQPDFDSEFCVYIFYINREWNTWKFMHAYQIIRIQIDWQKLILIYILELARSQIKDMKILHSLWKQIFKIVNFKTTFKK